MAAECSRADFFRIEKIGEGAYGVVYKAQHKMTGKLVAMKKMKLEKEEEGIPPTAIREISILKELSHKNIVELLNVIIENGKMYLIFEFLPMDLAYYLNKMSFNKFPHPELIKSYMYQLNDAILFCHRRRILHRDLKPQNLLIDRVGNIKVADFGLGRAFSIPLRVITHEVVTLWYRAPEILLGSARYSCPIDVWSMGCIFSEMVLKRTLFQGDCEINQIFCIFRILGTPTEDLWPGVSSLPDYKVGFPKWSPFPLELMFCSLSEDALDLLMKMLIYDPNQRISSLQISQHKYFNNRDMTIKPEL